jgi:hypothetical protein
VWVTRYPPFASLVDFGSVRNELRTLHQDIEINYNWRCRCDLLEQAYQLSIFEDFRAFQKTFPMDCML